MYRQTCINGHPATKSLDDGKPWQCGDPECEYFEDADDTALGLDVDPWGNFEKYRTWPCQHFTVGDATNAGCSCGALWTRARGWYMPPRGIAS